MILCHWIWSYVIVDMYKILNKNESYMEKMLYKTNSLDFF